MKTPQELIYRSNKIIIKKSLNQASTGVKEAGKRAVVQIQTKNPQLTSKVPPVLGKLLKSTTPSRSSSHGSDINMGMTSPSSESHQPNGDGGDDGIKKLTILHYNDVYNIDSQGM